MSSGAEASWMNSAMHRVCTPSFALPVTEAASFIRMNRKALTIDGDAPVISVKNPEAATITAERTAEVLFPLPRQESSFPIII